MLEYNAAAETPHNSGLNEVRLSVAWQSQLQRSTARMVSPTLLLCDHSSPSLPPSMMPTGPSRLALIRGTWDGVPPQTHAANRLTAKGSSPLRAHRPFLLTHPTSQTVIARPLLAARKLAHAVLKLGGHRTNRNYFTLERGRTTMSLPGTASAHIYPGRIWSPRPFRAKQKIKKQQHG